MSVQDTNSLIPQEAKDDLKLLQDGTDKLYNNMVKLVEISAKMRIGSGEDKSFAGSIAAIEKKQQATDELTISIAEYKKMQDQLAQTQAKMNALQSDTAKQLASLKISQQERNEQLKNEAKLQQAANNSIDEARAKVKLLTKERNSLNLATVEGKARQQELNAEIDKHNAFIKDNVDQYQKQKINIGNYSGALTVLESELTKVRKLIEDNTNAGNQNTAMIERWQREEALLTQLVENQAAGFASATGELRNNEKALQQLAAAGLENTEIYKQLLAETAQLKDNVSDLKQTIKGMASDTHVLDGMVGAAQLLAGSYGTAMAAAELFGAENEDVQKSMQKLQAVTTLLIGVQQIANALQKESSFMLLLNTARTKAMAAAQWLWNFATQATTASLITMRSIIMGLGLGAVLLLISSTAAAMEKWGEATDDETDKLKKLNDQLKIQNDYTHGLAEGYKAQSDKIIAQMEAEGATSEAIRKQKEEDANEYAKIQKEAYDRAAENLSKYASIEKKIRQHSKDLTKDEIESYNKALEEKDAASKAYYDALDAAEVLSYHNQKERRDEQKEADKKAEEERKKRQDEEKKRAEERKKIADEDFKAQYETQKKELELNIVNNQSIADNDKFSDETRLAAFTQLYKDKIALINATAEFEKMQGNKTATELKEIESQKYIALKAASDEALNYDIKLIEEGITKEKEAAERRKQIAEEELQHEKIIADKKKEIAEELKEAKTKLLLDEVSATVALGNVLFEKESKDIDKKKANIDKEKEQQLAYIESLNISEQDRRDRKYRAEQQAFTQQKLLDKQKEDLDKKKFVLDKASALAKIIIDTQLAVAKIQAEAAVLLATPATAGLAAGALAQIPYVYASGAIAAGVIAAQVLTYAEGTPDGGHPGGPAIYGEAGPEKVEIPGQNPFIATSPTLHADLPKGTIVTPLPGFDSFLSPQLMLSLTSQNRLDTRRLEDKLDLVSQAIKEKPVPSLTIARGAITESIQIGNTRLTRIKRNITD